MKKMQLDLSELHVESFATASPAKAAGTVRGQEGPPTMTFACCSGLHFTQVESCSGPIACICESQQAITCDIDCP